MSSPSKLNLWQKLSRFSPMTVRLLARKPSNAGRPLAISDRELCALSGLSMGQVKHISWSESWDSITVAEMRAFMRACGVDVSDRRSVRLLGHYMRRGYAFSYLRRSPDWHLTFEPLMKQWLATN